MKALILVLALIFIVSCDQSIKKKFNHINNGMTQQEVEQVLSKATQVYQATYSQGLVGPGESLYTKIPSHRKYMVYKYKDKKMDYYIFFSGESEKNTDSWVVIIKESYPEDAIF